MAAVISSTARRFFPICSSQQKQHSTTQYSPHPQYPPSSLAVSIEQSPLVAHLVRKALVAKPKLASCCDIPVVQYLPVLNLTFCPGCLLSSRIVPGNRPPLVLFGAAGKDLIRSEGRRKHRGPAPACHLFLRLDRLRRVNAGHDPFEEGKTAQGTTYVTTHIHRCIPWTRKKKKERKKRKEKKETEEAPVVRGQSYIITQHPPFCCGAYGSSLFCTGPHTDGTM